jgi:YHS domain-containing protein
MKSIAIAVTILFVAVGLAVAAKPYPLTTCLVTGEKLGSMGTPVVKVYDGQEVKFCCKSCVKKFEAAKTKYLKKLH